MRADFLRALSWNFLSPAHVSSRDDGCAGVGTSTIRNQRRGFL